MKVTWNCSMSIKSVFVSRQLIPRRRLSRSQDRCHHKVYLSPISFSTQNPGTSNQQRHSFAT